MINFYCALFQCHHVQSHVYLKQWGCILIWVGETRANGDDNKDDADMVSADFASKEVVLCAGAIDTPKLLLLSGIGPKEHLATHDISLVAEVPQIGAHLMDHPMIRIAAVVKQGVVENYIAARAENTKAQKEAQSAAQPGEDIASAGHGYFKLEGVENYPGFELLGEDIQSHLTNPLTPAYELVCVSSPWSRVHLISFSFKRCRGHRL